MGWKSSRRIRSQAIAQTHQGPLSKEEQQALALLPREWKLRGTMWSITCASIIAPGREGSQLPVQNHQGPLNLGELRALALLVAG